MEKQMTTKKSNPRNLWIELYRLIAILFIISSHWVANNGLSAQFPDLGRIGVVIFIAISGYFGCNITQSRTPKMLVKTIIWSIYGFILFAVLHHFGSVGDNPWNIFFGKFLGNKYSSWYFIYIYLGFTIIQPWVNKVLHNSKKWATFGVILVFMLLVCTANHFLPQNFSEAWYYMNFRQMFMFIYVYCLTAWISIWYKEKNNNHKISTSIVTSILFALMFLVLWYRLDIMKWLNERKIDGIYIYEFSSIIGGISGLLLLNCLPKTKVKWLNVGVCYIGNSTLAMYLFHPIVWGLFDLTIVFTNLVHKYLFYISMAVLCSLAFNAFILIQEKGVWILINKIKNKKNNQLQETKK